MKVFEYLNTDLHHTAQHLYVLNEVIKRLKARMLNASLDVETRKKVREKLKKATAMYDCILEFAEHKLTEYLD